MSTVSALDTVRVLICDDHAVFRRGLAMVLADGDGVEVVGEACDGTEAVERARELQPDVVLMDVRMPGLTGIDATRRIATAVPGCRIVMLTVSDEEDDLYEAVKAGAVGYLLKDVSIEEVGDAVRSVVAGHSLITPSMAAKLVTEFSALARRAEGRPAAGAMHSLTDREIEVLRLVSTGRTNRDIAEKLFISENTVKNHVRNILDKLHLHSRTEAAMYAVREHLIDPG
ncbi:MAG: response regulator transcription factor [Actinobacteria bacterium]|nr:response regulator transcription factor [Actinomycetota bacterium]